MIWENFAAEEFECKHCGKNKISYDFNFVKPIYQ